MKLNGGVATAQPPKSVDFGFGKPSWFEASLETIVPNRVVSGSASSTTTVDDANLNVFTGATTAVDKSLNLEILQPRTYGTAPTKTLTGNGFVQFGDTAQTILQSVGNGAASLSLVSPTRTLVLPVIGQVSTSSTTALTSWVSGSLARHIYDSMTTLATGITPPNGLTANTFIEQASLFTTKENGGGIAVRNTAHWLSSIALSGISTWNSAYGNPWQAIAVSTRHLINAAHVAYPPGTNIWFCSADGNNTRVSRTITSYQTFNYLGAATDIGLATLNQDLPAWVSIAKVMPANWATVKCPDLSYTLPFIFVTQDQFASIRSGATDGQIVMTTRAAVSADIGYSNWNPYAITPRSGDSGMPFLTVVNNELVLLAVGSSVSDARCISPIISQLNTAMATAGAYSLSQANLSSFPSY
jgi:hypothetical protein